MLDLKQFERLKQELKKCPNKKLIVDKWQGVIMVGFQGPEFLCLYINIEKLSSELQKINYNMNDDELINIFRDREYSVKMICAFSNGRYDVMAKLIKRRKGAALGESLGIC